MLALLFAVQRLMAQRYGVVVAHHAHPARWIVAPMDAFSPFGHHGQNALGDEEENDADRGGQAFVRHAVVLLFERVIGEHCVRHQVEQCIAGQCADGQRHEEL